jgi:AraC-like DNA-binding protein
MKHKESGIMSVFSRHESRPRRSGSAGRSRFWGSFFLSHLLVLLVSLVFGLFIYQQSINIITENVKTENLNRLEQAWDAFSSNLEKAEIILTQIALDQKVLYLMYNQNRHRNELVYEIRQLINSLLSYNNAADFITGCFVIFYEWDSVVDFNTLHTTRSFFDSYFAGSGESFQDWLAGQYRKSPHLGFYQASNITLAGIPRRVYEYTVSIPYASIQKSLGSIHVVFSENSIRKIMDPLGTQEFSYIADNKGNIISFFSNRYRELPAGHTLIADGGQSGYFTEKTETGKNIIYFVRSSDNKWVFVTAQSMESIFGRVNKTRNLFLLALVLSVVLALIVSLFLSWRKAYPLSSIMNSLQEYSGRSDSGKGGDFISLQNSVMNLISENSAIHSEMERQQPVLQNVFLSRLLRGEISNEDEIQGNISRMRIEIEGRNFIVVLAQIEKPKVGNEPSSFSDVRAVKAVLSEIIQSSSQEISFLEADLDENTTAFIGIASFFDPSGYMRRCKDFFTIIRDKLSGEFFIFVRFSIGQPTDIFSRLYHSFDTAKYAQERNLLRPSGMGISVFDSSVKSQKHYDYPMAVETRLINFAREGNMDGIRTVLNYIFENRNSSGDMDNESLKLFLAAVKNTLFRINTMMFSGDTEVYHALDAQIIGIAHFDKGVIVEVFESMCRIVRKRQGAPEQELKESIIKYVHENYRRNDFYLGSLTSHYNLSETYLSLFFKECTGENFIAYVEQLRLQDACELLKNLSVSIETITSLVGYSSSHAFRRAFKRRFGISPTEYRNQSFNADKTDRIRQSL